MNDVVSSSLIGRDLVMLAAFFMQGNPFTSSLNKIILHPHNQRSKEREAC